MGQCFVQGGGHTNVDKIDSESQKQNNLSPTVLNGTVILMYTKTLQQPLEIVDIRTGILLTRTPHSTFT